MPLIQCYNTFRRLGMADWLISVAPNPARRRRFSGPWQQRRQRCQRNHRTVDDLLVSRDGKQPYAVLSIGGFLGMGTRLVVVPYDLLKFADKRVTLPGGTKEGLKMLPEFKYATG